MPSKYIVYVDESGSTTLEPAYPVFVLAFCLFEVETYFSQVVPSFQELKFEIFGHDLVVLHEREIRRAIGSFSFLNVESRRVEFLERLTNVIAAADFKIFAGVVQDVPECEDTYLLGLRQGIEGIREFISAQEINETDVSLVLESRSKKQDKQVIAELKNLTFLGKFVIAPKTSMSTGLQIADLVARPIGLSRLWPDQPNRSLDAIKNKIQS